ncbi:hypothetical protein Mgra_00008293 [Meloidogyne graminicola]|uniref:Uncharacterized protein n=1 Tax=Meloidogyne graminicola TaxID=189291 RepID=A0A8S9ZG44_9BILA|nr:hypothetical protein Mgra_00008293 [Meloidogyne graminicola]
MHFTFFNLFLINYCAFPKESKSQSISTYSSTANSPSFNYIASYQHLEGNNNENQIHFSLPSNSFSLSNSNSSFFPPIVFDRYNVETDSVVGNSEHFGNANTEINSLLNAFYIIFNREISSGTTVDIVDRTPFYLGAGGRLPIGEQPKMSSLEKLISNYNNIILQNVNIS